MGNLFTPNGTPLSLAISALTKACRRNEVEMAVVWAHEIAPRYSSYLWKRLEIFGTEDVGMADLVAVHDLFASSLLWRQLNAERLAPNPDGVRCDDVVLASTVAMLAGCQKSREAADFCCMPGLAVMEEGFEIVAKPDALWNDEIARFDEAVSTGDEVAAMKAAARCTSRWAQWLWSHIVERAQRRIADPFLARLLNMVRWSAMRDMAEKQRYEWHKLGFAVLVLCRSQPMTHPFVGALQLAYEVRASGRPYDILDCAYDRHTAQGRAMKRDYDHYMKEASWSPQRVPSSGNYEQRYAHLTSAQIVEMENYGATSIAGQLAELPKLTQGSML